ncbi:competence/damage-inducible protein A [Pseudobdellovibrio exovorus]|uniref:Nucleotide-utilizing enzyme n=1 Tax=Pseudobdellovibrio exovorus JSS TaxID=1184267 RepID=M4VCZ3_9BACT|nr:molybdopterin-binding protein [Pseudobdellovibrio exovorus]AGH95906.1 nucleotide-utilizing enzyme [Pseudobdellovibrio exovorus JSS]
MKASILAVGTELTTGQITNRNAVTLSEKLTSFGIVINSHLTVADNRETILSALQFLETQSDLIFITGGLGPTSDDFTRDVVADWAQVKMVFDETSWQHITQRLTNRGFQVREMQKQQCYFPEDSRILYNVEGTANGFQFDVLKNSGKKTVFVLPGPPREIAAIWRDHLNETLTELMSGTPKIIIRSWDTLGLGESDIASRVEEVLKDRPSSPSLEIGYRVHHPYCEVKLSYSEKDKAVWEPWVKKVDAVLDDVTITRDFADIFSPIVERLSNRDFTFYDFASHGNLHFRLSPHLKSISNWSFKQNLTAPSVDLFDHEDDFLALLPYNDLSCILLYSVDGQRYQKQIEPPLKSPLMQERRYQYYAEIALIELGKPSLQ